MSLLEAFNESIEYLTSNEYMTLHSNEINSYYNKWLKNNEFMKFTYWESRVLRGDIKLVKENINKRTKLDGKKI